MEKTKAICQIVTDTVEYAKVFRDLTLECFFVPNSASYHAVS